mmetsp:Transcript_23028/g.36756  ORF Transcript_23028/g.36756 Transcript_23028/m.36756 type:complete len:956 (+) Transcript_23028:58-2925(+)
MLQKSGKPVPDAWLEAVSDDPAWLLSARAAAATDAHAQYELGLEYLRGTRLKENVRIAAHWLRKAAAAKHAKAAYLMALLTRGGEGTSPSVAKFLGYLRHAAQQGLAAAQAELGKLYSRGILVQRDLVRARELFLHAASSGDVIAMKQLARLPMCLAAEPRNIDSRYWWDRAAAAGDAEALFEITKYASNGDQHLAFLIKAGDRNFPEALRELGELYRQTPCRRSAPRRDCERATNLLANACNIWRDQASKLKEAIESHTAKWKSAFDELEEYVDEQLTKQRVVAAWHYVASSRRQSLYICMERCCERWKRFAWTRLLWNCHRRKSLQICEMSSPLHSVVLRQRVFTSWRLLKHECNVSLVKRILQRSVSMRSSVSKTCACRRLCRVLQECFRRQYGPYLQNWSCKAQRVGATIRLSRLLRRCLRNRCYAPALDTWRSWVMTTEGSEHTSEVRQVEARLAMLRERAEDLLIQHGLELDTWRRWCDEEAALVSSLESKSRSPSRDIHTDEMFSGHADDFDRSYFRDEGCSRVPFTLSDVHDADRLESDKSFGHAPNKEEPRIEMRRLKDDEVCLREPTWPGKFEEQMSRRLSQDRRGEMNSPMQVSTLGSEQIEGGFVACANLASNHSPQVDFVRLQMPQMHQLGPKFETGLTNHPAGRGGPGLDLRIRCAIGSSDPFTHTLGIPVRRLSDSKGLGSMRDRSSPLLEPTAGSFVGQSKAHTHHGKAKVPCETVSSTSLARSDSMNPGHHDSTTFADTSVSSMPSASWRYCSRLSSNNRQRSPPRIADIDSILSSPSLNEPTSSSSSGQKRQCATRHSCSSRSNSCSPADANGCVSDCESSGSSRSRRLERIYSESIIQSNQRLRQTQCVWPRDQCSHNCELEMWKVRGRGSLEADVRPPPRRVFNACAVATVATPTRIGMHSATNDPVTGQRLKDSASAGTCMEFHQEPLALRRLT